MHIGDASSVAFGNSFPSGRCHRGVSFGLRVQCVQTRIRLHVGDASGVALRKNPRPSGRQQVVFLVLGNFVYKCDQRQSFGLKFSLYVGDSLRTGLSFPIREKRHQCSVGNGWIQPDLILFTISQTVVVAIDVVRVGGELDELPVIGETITISIVEILHKSGVDFHTVGNRYACGG